MEDLHLLKDLINQANDAIFIVSPETGYLLDFNDTAHKILGYTRKELLNMRVPDICLSVTDNSSFDIKVKEARGKGYLFFEGEQKRKDGSTFTVELNIRYISNEKNDYLIVIARDITRRKMAEEALKESEKRYEDLYENAPDMFVSVDVKTTKILRCNQTVATALGYSKKEIIGRPIFEMYHPDCMENVKKAFKSFLETGEVHNAELQLKRKDGSKIEVCLNVAAVRDEQGNILYSSSILRDITERKKAEEALKKSSFYLDNINDTLIIINAEREIIEVNREFSNLWGYSSEEILGKPVFKILPEKEVPKHLSEMKKAVSTKKPRYFETVALTKSGEKVPLSIRGSAFFDKDGKLEGFIGIFRDITESKQANEALKESEQKIRALFEGLPHALYECNVNGINTTANPAYSKITGYTNDEIIGMYIWDMMEPGPQKDSLPAYLKQLVKEQPTPSPYVTRILTKDKRLIDVQVDWTYKQNQQGQVKGFFCILSDITERKKAEEKIQQAAEEWDKTFNSISDLVSIHRKDLTITKVNKAFTKALNLKPEDIVGKKCYELFHKGDKPLPECPFERTKKDLKPHTQEIDDPNIGIPLLITTSPIFDSKGEFVGSVHIAKDFTERKKIEKELLKADENLRIQSKELEESNTALKVLLKQRENDKGDLEEDILANIKHLILPYIKKLKKNRSMSEELAYLNILESNLMEIISPFSTKLSSHYLGFTPKEIQIADLIKDGKQDKDIMEMLNISLDTVKTHRQNIRKKLGIHGKRINLRTHLFSKIK